VIDPWSRRLQRTDVRTHGFGWLLALGLGACAFPAPDVTMPEACPAALLEGRLAPDGRGGALVMHAEFGPQPVDWPDGYRVDGDEEIVLRDPAGGIVATEGDIVYVGGGFTADDSVFLACGYVSRDPP
jgi:hypothetical protein